MDGNERSEYFELDRWMWAHEDEKCKTLSDRCLALRDARILSEDVGTWHQPGEHTVLDMNNCRNIAILPCTQNRDKQQIGQLFWLASTLGKSRSMVLCKTRQQVQRYPKR